GGAEADVELDALGLGALLLRGRRLLGPGLLGGRRRGRPRLGLLAAALLPTLAGLALTLAPGLGKDLGLPARRLLCALLLLEFEVGLQHRRHQELAVGARPQLLREGEVSLEDGLAHLLAQLGDVALDPQAPCLLRRRKRALLELEPELPPQLLQDEEVAPTDQGDGGSRLPDAAGPADPMQVDGGVLRQRV